MKQPVLELLVERKLSILVEKSPAATSEMAMGSIVSEYAGYSDAKIVVILVSALEDAGFLEEAEEIRRIGEKLMKK
jgi:hypothetical protein